MEEWKSIPGYEGYYEASNLGRIRTVDGKPTNRDGFVWHWKGRILKPKYQKRHKVGKIDGSVNLSIDGHVRTFLVLGRADTYILKCIKHHRPIVSVSGERYGLV